jgi:hypothetical protein
MPKLRIDYNKYSSDRKHVDQTEKRQSQEGFFETLSGERVQVELTSGKQIEGILRADLYNKYDIELETEEEVYLIRKDILGVVKCRKGDKKK